MACSKLYVILIGLLGFSFLIAINEAAHDGTHHKKGPGRRHHSKTPHHKHHQKGPGRRHHSKTPHHKHHHLSLTDIENAVGKLSSGKFGGILKQELSPGSVANVLAEISPKLAGDLITYVPKSDIIAVFETLSADMLKGLLEQENADFGTAGSIESIPDSKLPQIYASLPNSTIGRLAAGFPNSVKAHLFANLPNRTVGEVAQHLPQSIQIKAIEALPKSEIEELAGHGSKNNSPESKGESTGSTSGSPDRVEGNGKGGLPDGNIGHYGIDNGGLPGGNLNVPGVRGNLNGEIYSPGSRNKDSLEFKGGLPDGTGSLGEGEGGSGLLDGLLGGILGGLL